MSELAFNPTLGRQIRSASAADLGIPTDTLLTDALDAGDQGEAIRLFDYLVEETGRIFTVLVTWLDSQLNYGREHIHDWATQVANLERIIGAPPPVMEIEHIAASEVDTARRILVSGDLSDFPAALRRMRETQWKVHDDLTDWLWGLLTVMRDALGEEAMDDVFRATIEKFLTARYSILPKLTQREAFELAIEGMRAHFCGPEHTGSIEVEEDDEKWVMAFDPCGSGGRMRRGDSAASQSARTAAPYHFGVTEQAHDWSWQKEGVCLYCAHCAVANEIIPIEHLGAPMRVTDYPEQPGDKCRWTIYKNQDDVPDWAYERVGKLRRTPETRSEPRAADEPDG